MGFPLYNLECVDRFEQRVCANKFRIYMIVIIADIDVLSGIGAFRDE